MEERTVFNPVAVQSGEVEDDAAPPGEVVEARRIEQVSIDGVVASREIGDGGERCAALEERDGPEAARDRRAQQVRPDEPVCAGDAYGAVAHRTTGYQRPTLSDQ